MAYLTPQTPVCPNCGHSEALVWVTGMLLDKEPGTVRAYRRVHKAGGWRVEKTEGKSLVFCPPCTTKVAHRSLKP